MRAAIVLVVCLAAVASGFRRKGPLPLNILKSKDFHGHPNEKIVGGDVADPNSIPHQVSFQFFGSHGCGGSVINENYVLTAGHCCDGTSASSITIVGGEHDLASDSGLEQEREVSRVILHEDFDYGTISNDVCLLELAQPFELGAEVNGVSLPTQGQLFESGDAVVSGWGTLHSGDFFLPDLLHVVTVPIVTDQDCADAYGSSLIADQMICAGETDKDSCQGDSGGPMTCGGLHCGVVSWGIGCGSPGYPGVYAETAQYIDWINGHIKK